MIEFIHDFTEDGLKLQAAHWYNDNKDICVVAIHGMSGNILENYFAHVWGNELIENNIGFIYGHTRGHSHLNDIVTINGDFKRIGTTYEIFDECIYDIDLWIKKANELGYKKVILLGHSLGCNKSIFYLYNSYLNKTNIVDGLILASAPDLRGKLQSSISNYDELINEAENNIKNGDHRKLLSKSIYNWYNLSSATFISLYGKESNCNNMPIKDKEEVFKQLSVIDIPILTFSGEKEHSLYHKLEFIQTKATSCSNFTHKIIKGSGHTYVGKENETADLIIEWIKSIFSV
ncbi:MAG: DUF1749 domain-containing protein [Clostridia bacterium]|nr:DUF1749 domain-containing protein [Clostridia bacterium]